MSASVYLVTGASGFVGRQLCRHLVRAGHRVRALVRRDDPGLAADGVELVRGDLSQPGEWEQAIGPATYVIHCAARASFAGKSCTADNVDGTHNLLRAVAAGGGTRRLVFVSTIGAVDRAPADACGAPLTGKSPTHPSSEYGRSKLAAEGLVRASGLPYCIVRPAMVVGADMRVDSHFAVFARAAVRGAPLARIGWPGRFSVVHVDDLVAALVLCATHPAAVSRTFFCAGAPVALGDFFASVAPAGWRLPAGGAGGLAAAFPRLVPFKLKALLLPALTADDDDLRQLGWRPSVPVETALHTVVERERVRLDPSLDPGGQTVVTGAASGLGRAVALRLADRRRNLLLVDRDRAGLEELQRRLPDARVAMLDLAEPDQVGAFTRSAAWRAFPVRELYACAGFGRRGPVQSSPAEAHARLFQVNVLARLALAEAALPAMVREGFGRIVFVSSSSAFQPLPYMATYAAANAALLSLGEAWAAELGGTGVQLVTACPGGMQTNFQASAGVRQPAGERLMSPEEVADAILAACRRGRTTVIISFRAQAMASLARVLPRGLSVALWKRLMARLR